MIEPTESPAILWEDAHLLVVDKPAGILTQGTAGGEGTLEDAIRRHLKPSDPASVYLGTTHRLDRPVSGVIVWTKTPKAARRLAESFAQRGVTKVYLGVVEGVVRAGASVWEDLLGPVGAEGTASIVQEAGRRAVTRVWPIVDCRLPEGLSLLRLEPETGRTHQLRVQASGRGLPILGDVRYGAVRPFARGIALHASRIVFEHPVTRRSVVIETPPPAEWSRAGIVVPR